MKFKKGDRVEVIWRSELYRGAVTRIVEATDEIEVKLAKKPAIDYLFKQNQVSKVELVKVPQFAADAINTFKEKEYDIAVAINYETYTDELVKELSLDRKMRGWLWETSNQELFARAWIEGYEIEKEPLYYVRFIPGNSVSYLNLRWVDKGLILNSCGQDDIYKTKFTEKEIKNMNINYWAFKVPVEELEA
ncbi:DUF1642 domain-containing protein [Listeria monocytogenes]|uniref:DUF1642 domain-containing protein n=1 Tax=Listeria monocytogenes TaxID=1639 RepID=UPI0016454DA1|nr:DUF1642 domain-containing protein [Listeria monocytogenes]MBC3548095.1 DUF1642 domain-containing protein [Listeria monocytogenes]